MPPVPSPEAWLSQDGSTVHMRRGGWTGEFPIADLGRWLGFYRDLQNRALGKFAYVYGPTVAALERIEIELRRQ
ncbi:MAG: hypothetical protein J0H79_15335 [Alphaproteobacteria bacterium]|nr:hypothetical protein [Alphaproteobacteria bacterium]